MARSPRRPPAQTKAAAGDAGSTAAAQVPFGTTGRSLVLFQSDAGAAKIKNLAKSAGVAQFASFADFKAGAVTPEDLGAAGGLVFPDLGVAVVDTPPEQLHGIAAAAESGVMLVEPERIVYAVGSGVFPQPIHPSGVGAFSPGAPLDYLRGYRDAVNHLYEALAGSGAAGVAAEAEAPAFAETEFTWGLQATKVPASRYTGKGIRVAVLDTGLDTEHPDFAGRQITTQSFVPDQPVQDGHGHGTHCIGTACGTRQPGMLPRYGIAYEAEIYAGKVLSNQGSGADSGILGGIQWALTNQCPVVSMSLGAPTQVGQPYSQIFEQVAVRALGAGTLIIAAAGNDSRRPQYIAPVSHPANCPSIMAVAAVDRLFQIAFFSNGGLNPQGGQVDIAGPGVDVRSSWPRPTLYNTISGTSMATPHVAGMAALWAEADASHRGRALMSILGQSARRLTLPGRDVGAGLVQAP